MKNRATSKLTIYGLALAYWMFASVSYGNGLPIPCGGKFENFLSNFLQEATIIGISKNTIKVVSELIEQDKKVLFYDRSQKSFKMSFLEFSERAVNDYRLKTGKKKIQAFQEIFLEMETIHGIPAEIVTSFWAMETDYGAVQGDFNTLNSLATLAHDCRRSKMFQLEFLAALKLIGEDRIDFNTKGAWAGEIGQVQMLPRDILRFGKDGNSDGKIDLRVSPEDAIATAFELIAHLGWRPNEPWLDEVILKKNFKFEEAGFGRGRSVRDWASLGVRNIPVSILNANTDATLLLPQGHKGPSFLAYPNYEIFLKWNDSFIYTVAAAYLAKRLQGSKSFTHTQPEKILNQNDMIILQERLFKLGEDVGKLDGILGAKTRQAVRKWQIKLGFIGDSWPTRQFLQVLKAY